LSFFYIFVCFPCRRIKSTAHISPLVFPVEFKKKNTIRQTGRDAGVNARRAELGKQHSVRYKFLFLQELQWRAVWLYIDEGALAPRSTSRLDFFE
jgi:hypothetical protein